MIPKQPQPPLAASAGSSHRRAQGQPPPEPPPIAALSNTARAARRPRFGDLDTPAAIRAETAGVDAYIEAEQRRLSTRYPTAAAPSPRAAGFDAREAARSRHQVNQPGIPNVVHTLFHLMQCKETQLFKDVRVYTLAEIEQRVAAVMGNTWISRPQMAGALRRMFPEAHVTPAECSVLFELVDIDNNGDVGLAEMLNGLLLLLSSDRHTLLQRCRNIVAERSTSSLVYLSRFELLLLVDALVEVYRTDSDFDFIRSELSAMLGSFDFALRGRIQLKDFEAYVEEHPSIGILMTQALDLHTLANPDLSTLTVFEKAAGEDDQERVFFSRKAPRGRDPRPKSPQPANAFIVRDQEAQQKVVTPADDRQVTTEGLRWGVWAPCYVIQENRAANTATVEWAKDAGVSLLGLDSIRERPASKHAAAHAVDPATADGAKVPGDPKPEKEVFRKNQLNVVPPLRQRLLQGHAPVARKPSKPPRRQAGRPSHAPPQSPAGKRAKRRPPQPVLPPVPPSRSFAVAGGAGCAASQPYLPFLPEGLLGLTQQLSVYDAGDICIT
ncbi:hypothetical protein DIPPA_09548 [Diplonema papillatum]|nr:hypothetical protein DIPPA_09548 [Diplonema papillatum]